MSSAFCHVHEKCGRHHTIKVTHIYVNCKGKKYVLHVNVIKSLISKVYKSVKHLHSHGKFVNATTGTISLAMYSKLGKCEIPFHKSLKRTSIAKDFYLSPSPRHPDQLWGSPNLLHNG
jgi:hypothetical protein